jgi:hypothetical protein
MSHFEHDGAIRADLRRRRRQSETDLIQMRAEFLPPSDAAFIRSLYVDGLSAAKLATLRNEDPRAVRRRARRILKRLNEPLFIFVVRERASWSGVRRRIAEAGVLAGHGLRAVARETGLSIHVVRRHLEAIRAMGDAAPRPGRPEWRAHRNDPARTGTDRKDAGA